MLPESAAFSIEVKRQGRATDSQDKHGSTLDFLEAEVCEVKGALGSAWLGNETTQEVFQGLLPVPLA